MYPRHNRHPSLELINPFSFRKCFCHTFQETLHLHMNNLEITKILLLKTKSLCHVGHCLGNCPLDSSLNAELRHHSQKFSRRALSVPCAPCWTSYLIPGCCCTASSPCLPASSRTPTVTGSTGRQQSPTPGSSRLPHQDRALRRRTPVRPASAASAGSCAPTLPSR